MKKSTFKSSGCVFVFITILTIMTLPGCRNQHYVERPNETNSDKQSVQYYENADLQGTVIQVSEDELCMSPSIIIDSGDGGAEMVQATPGKENQADTVSVTYGENVDIQIVTIGMSTLSELSRETATVQDIKKHSDICIFGKCIDTYHWIADKILILRWQQEEL